MVNSPNDNGTLAKNQAFRYNSQDSFLINPQVLNINFKESLGNSALILNLKFEI